MKVARILQVCAAVAVFAVVGGAANGASGGTPTLPPGAVRPTSQILIGQIVKSPGFTCTPLVVGPCTLLKYHGGPVMKQVTDYTIFWIPSGFTVDAGYVSTINQYFTDLQAASGTTGNVYGVATQYCDGVATNATSCPVGNITTNHVFGGTWTDTAAFPSNGCTDPLALVSTCLSDAQLRTEVQHAISVNGWTHDTSHMFFIYTPYLTTNCYSTGVCAYNYYCAYHSNIGSTPSSAIIWANQPYPATTDPNKECGTGELPNGSLADEGLITTSHEENEAITDPIPNTGWFDNGDSTGGENGDKCAWYFGSESGTAGSKYNQTINAHHYYLQLEWSNADNDCLQTFSAPSQPLPTFDIKSPFKPTTGGPGTKVTITGLHFTGATAVKFNGVPATTFALKGDKSIQAVVPAGATTGVITVTTSAGDGMTSTDFTVPPPTVAKITPLSGVVGQPISISGKNMTVATAVKFNGTAAASFSGNASKIVAVVDAGTTDGTVSVTTAAGVGTSLDVFHVLPTPDPTIKSFKPTSLHVGQVVTLSGTGFWGTSAVKVNGTDCAFTVKSATQLSCTVGGGTTTGTIQVTTPGGHMVTSVASLTIS